MRIPLLFFLLPVLSSCFGSFSEGEKYFRQSEYEKAVSEFSKALFLNVTDIKSLHLRARSYEELEDFQSAMDDYKAILRLEPQYAQAHRGMVKLMKQDPSGCTDLQQAEARGSHYAKLHIDACR